MLGLHVIQIPKIGCEVLSVLAILSKITSFYLPFAHTIMSLMLLSYCRNSGSILAVRQRWGRGGQSGWSWTDAALGRIQPVRGRDSATTRAARHRQRYRVIIWA